ncbi:MAG: pantetheine-phosphate adenylyltransferase [Deltaproteobacteria bacterium]|nr:pantetheine-phosphate adenylyltransferase [Deltaproteobacteria bacterium]MBW2170414.1 pantetheine-phosphate adenylyltransferase [Deltaproteobacteria bacterium]
MGKIAVYPGSFDPVTNGHCDVVQRSLNLFDKIIIAVATNGTKDPLFTIEERLEMLKETFKEIPGVEVDSFDGLLVEYAAERRADAILRGLRAVSDFEHEFQMALMNRKLNRTVETVFLMTGLRWIFISSSIIKEAARFGGDTRGMVPDNVSQKLREKFGKA